MCNFPDVLRLPRLSLYKSGVDSDFYTIVPRHLATAFDLVDTGMPSGLCASLVCIIEYAEERREWAAR